MKSGKWTTVSRLACLLLIVFMIPGTALSKGVAKKPEANKPFMIKVVDAETGRGIPLVRLETTNNIVYYTDSAGVVAFDEPGLMNQSVFFHISSDGYEYPKDFFGYNGTAVDVTPGGSATITMTRTNLAERLYRVTGEGIYRDSVLLGLKRPIKEPLLNGRVMGQDTVQTIIYRNRLYWFWGDTNRPAYPLGNFRVSGATSKLPGKGGLDPDVGVNLEYFTNEEGFVKSLVPPLDDGAGIVWVHGLMTVKDETGRERLLAGYSTHNPETVSFGVLIFNDEKEEFEHLVRFPDKDDWRHPGGQAMYYEENGVGYYLFTEHRMPNLRVRATMDAIADYTQYESFTCLAPGTTFNGADTQVERDENGRLVWGWKLNTPPLTQDQEKQLIQLGVIHEDDPHYFQLKDADTGEEVSVAQNAVEWNEYRQRYVMIAQQLFGKTSVLGDMWYAEAPSPQGPWTTAKRIISHDNYTFYNPALHEYFFKEGGRYIYFEATYTNTYTDHVPTPRYNYNQIMYKLDLADPRLGLEPVREGAGSSAN
jgi:hypothetical protein